MLSYRKWTETSLEQQKDTIHDYNKTSIGKVVMSISYLHILLT